MRVSVGRSFPVIASPATLTPHSLMPPTRISLPQFAQPAIIRRGARACRIWLPLVSVILITVGNASLLAAPLDRELGEQLYYHRAGILPSDLPPPDLKAGAMILDLRYALAEFEAKPALNAWLKSRATPGAPVIVLYNSDTAPALRELFSAGSTLRGVITIGRDNAQPKPDIAINSTDAEERQAYDALGAGSAVEALISENTDKPRMDEASIMRAHSDARSDVADTVVPDEDVAGTPTPSNAPPPPPIDRALQRAVHLHRALLALKRN